MSEYAIADENGEKSLNNYKLFITSDHQEFKQRASSEFGADKVVYNHEHPVHMDRDFTNLKENCASIENVLVDFHMLQHCDEMVVSHSGFGILGAWNRPDPLKNFYVFTKSNQNDLRANYWERSNLKFRKITDLENDLYFL